MALYKSAYITDSNVRLGSAPLTVNLVDGVTLLTSRGSTSATTYEYDAVNVPNTFLNFVTRPNKVSEVCDVPRSLVIKRFAKLYISSTSYIKVELPWLPNSFEFNNFMIEAASNFPTVVTLGYEGEFLSREWFKLYGKR